jgi:hypothetical protein
LSSHNQTCTKCSGKKYKISPCKHNSIGIVKSLVLDVKWFEHEFIISSGELHLTKPILLGWVGSNKKF